MASSSLIDKPSFQLGMPKKSFEIGKLQAQPIFPRQTVRPQNGLQSTVKGLRYPVVCITRQRRTHTPHLNFPERR